MSWDVSERFTIRSLVFTRVLVILVNFFHIPLRTRGRSGGWGEGRIRVINDRSVGNNERSRSCGGEVRGEKTRNVNRKGDSGGEDRGSNNRRLIHRRGEDSGGDSGGFWESGSRGRVKGSPSGFEDGNDSLIFENTFDIFFGFFGEANGVRLTNFQNVS